MDKKVVIIGASNIDIKGKSRTKTFSKTKNPGKVEFSPGGVGRNIAENLARLGVHSTLLSVVGNEGFSDLLINSTKNAGVDVSKIKKCEENSGIFLAIINSRGELDASISDMGIMSEITPEYIRENIDIIKESDYMVVDADIPDQTLLELLSISKKYSIPICVEPVSPSRAHSIQNYMNGVTLTTPNKEELESLVNRQITDEKDIIDASEELLKMGVENIIITLGSEGAYCASKTFKGFIPSVRTMVINSVGAGDALVAGTIAGLMDCKSFEESVKIGIACATITITDEKAVSDKLTKEKALGIAGKITSYI